MNRERVAYRVQLQVMHDVHLRAPRQTEPCLVFKVLKNEARAAKLKAIEAKEQARCDRIQALANSIAVRAKCDPGKKRQVWCC